MAEADAPARLLSRIDGFHHVWRNRDLRRIEIAFVGFNVARRAMWVALLVYAFRQGGTSATATVGLVALLPAALLAPLLATLGDRLPRDQVLLAGYVFQALSGALIAIAIAADVAPIVVYALAAAMMTSVSLTRPLHATILPSLAFTPAELAAANAVGGAIQGFGRFAGPLAAALVLGVAGPTAVFASSAVLAVAGAVAVYGIAPVPVPRHWGVDDAPPTIGASLRVGVAATRTSGAGPLLGLLTTQAAAAATVEALLVALALRVLLIGDAGVGLLNAAFGGGAALGAIAAALLVSRPRLTLALVGGTLVWAAALAGAALFPAPLSVCLLLLGAGTGRTLVEVGGQTLLHRVVPDRVLSRVFGVQEGLYTLGLAIGLTLAPLLARVAGIQGSLVVVGIALLMMALLVVEKLVSLDRRADVPLERIAILQRIPFFAPLGRLTLERVARGLVPIDAPRSTRIIHEGDVGDRFFVIERGTVEVTRQGRAIDHHGHGGYFGEIALLRRVPRTASVTAQTDVLLLALERDDFLEAVTGMAESRQAAETVADARVVRGHGAVAPRADETGPRFVDKAAEAEPEA